MDAGFLHFASPGDIIGFVETGFEFDEYRDLFFILGGGDESIKNGGVTAGAVQGHFDRENLGIEGGLFQERNNRLEAFVGVKQKNVSLADRFKSMGTRWEGSGDGGGEEWIVEFWIVATLFG